MKGETRRPAALTAQRNGVARAVAMIEEVRESQGEGRK
jgi:hypothetical protein